jgi:S-adenosylmethionine:tRNA ribosyltransferase-isomerase
MLTSEFDYDLPTELIAQEAAPRGESRLLHLGSDGTRQHLRISELPRLLAAGDLLVVNNTKVLPARLHAWREATGGQVELLLVERLTETEWTALLKPGRRVRRGTRLLLADGLGVEIREKLDDGRYRIQFSEPIEPHLESLGHVPLPPYIKRADQPEDRTRYQTVFARFLGAIAAPTAGLHFNAELLESLREAGVGLAELTLHVGIGTFKPVTADLVHEHRMEPESYRVPAETAEAISNVRREGGRIVAVGTTTVRTLESVARQHGGTIVESEGTSDLFITPGFPFQVVDLLLTNFHLPRSTLLMLVAAFAGKERILEAYAEAIERRYRFFSYGDAMLMERPQ